MGSVGCVAGIETLAAVVVVVERGAGLTIVGLHTENVSNKNDDGGISQRRGQL